MVSADQKIYLQQWIAELRKRLIELDSLRRAETKAFFSVGMTTKGLTLGPALTPVRDYPGAVVAGVLVYDKTQALAVRDALRNFPLLNVLVDHELKHSLEVLDEGLLKELLPEVRVNDEQRSARSLSQLFHGQPYKPNDLTVDAVWEYVLRATGPIIGKRVAILGAGNIGFKLAIKFLDVGANIVLQRRTESALVTLCSSLEVLRTGTSGTIAWTTDVSEAMSSADIIIACASESSIIDPGHINKLRKPTQLIDVGKGTISLAAVQLCAELGIPVVRTDIYAHLFTVLSLGEVNYFYERIGSRRLESGLRIVSGGVLGADGDIAVDDFRDPRRIYGICNGAGDLKRVLSPAEQTLLAQLKKTLKQGLL